MNIEIETKVILHIEDGYRARLEIGDNPDAPEIAFRVLFEEDNKVVSDFTLCDSALPKLIEGLQIYLKSKKRN